MPALGAASSAAPEKTAAVAAGGTGVAAVIGRQRLMLALSALLAIAGALAGLLPYVVVYLVAEQLFLSTSPDSRRLVALTLWAGIAVLVKIALKALANAVSHAAAYRILADLRVALGERLSQMPLGRVRARSSGHLKKVVQDDVEQLELGLSHAIPDIAAAVAVPIASLVVMFVVSWQIGLAALAVIVLAVAMVVWAVRRSAGIAAGESLIKSRLNTSVISFLRGMKVIRSFVRTSSSFTATETAIADSERIEIEKMARSKWQAVASSAIIGSSVLFILPVGLWCAHLGLLSPSVLIFFLLIGTGFAQPLMGLMISMAVLQYQVEAGLRNINDVLSEPDLPVAASPGVCDGFTLECQSVSFRHAAEGDLVLNRIDLSIPERSSLALVGPSGGGKSTLISLFARFHDPCEGRVLLGGVDLREMDPAALMQQVAYVQQDDYLFADTVLENIRMARPSATDDEVLDAARRARVSDFVEELAGGWHARLAAGGGELSGGQRQRISIARAMLKGSPVVLLDEATAFLDPESENAVADALAELRLDATMITVAHRLGTVADYDQIAYLDQGTVVGIGSHQELQADCPAYAELWKDYQRARGWRLSGDSGEDPDSIQPRGVAGVPVDSVSVSGYPPAHPDPTPPTAGLGDKGPIGQWFTMLGSARQDLWRRGIWWIVVEGILASAPMVVVLLALLETLDSGVRADSWWRFGLPLLAIFVLRWMAGVGLASSWWKTATHAIADLQRSVLAHLRRIPLGAYDRLDVGRSATLVISDLPLIDFINLPAKIIVGLLQPLLAAIVLLILDWRLALAALAGVPIFLLLVWAAGRRQRGVLAEVGTARARANSELLELVQGTAVLRANPDAPQAHRYRAAVERLRRASVAMAVRTSPINSLASATLELGFALLILLVCLRTIDGTLSQTVAVLFLIISLSLYRPYQELMDLSSYRHLQGHIADRLAEVWDIEAMPGGTVQEVCGADVVLDDVTFGYRPDHPVLRNASLTARSGQVTALIGPSGTGKSTVTNLVARFWDVDRGVVRIGDQDVRDLSPDALARQVTAVHQDVYLFPATVRENLSLDGAVSDTRLEEALRAAQAWEFVQQLPGGLDAELSEGGQNLSGGQRQRLAIARALLKDAPILLLDEAVASVDPRTEVRIQQALGSLVRGRTVLVVAHRLNTIQSAERIVVLASHGVESVGRHEDLLRSSATYCRLWRANRQLSGL